MVLGKVQETITTIDIDEETYEETVKVVPCFVRRLMPLIAAAAAAAAAAVLILVCCCSCCLDCRKQVEVETSSHSPPEDGHK